MLIGLSGKKQHGKSTATNYLVNEYKFVEVSWAAPLKNKIGIDLLGLTEEQVYGDETIKEAVDPFWGKSPRQLLQIIGTDCFRDLVHPDFWVLLGKREIEYYLKQGKSVVVSDCRFPNEAQAIRDLEGKMVRMIRKGYGEFDPHPSECALDKYDFDYRIDANDGDIQGIHNHLDTIYELVK